MAADDGKDRIVRVAVLGPLEVTGAPGTVERPSHRRMLSILVQADAPLDAEQLADRFWPDEPPATWKAALQTHVSALRRLLGAERIRTTPSGYRLDLDGHELDVTMFRDAARRCRAAAERQRWQDVADAADEALTLWRGAPFAELADDRFATPDIVRLQELHVELTERRADALMRLGRHGPALPELEALAAEHPLRERTWELLITARARTGRIADALAAYRDLRARLLDVGLEPGPALRALETRILREDPAVVGRPAQDRLPVVRTRFVGRDQEIGELADLLRDHRLVTLTGVGGAGKTRLSQELARHTLDRFPDGVALIELAPISDPDEAASAVAVALGLRSQADPRDAIRGALSHRSTLCLLDNCEHLLDAAADLAGLLLEAGPGVRVVATSREPLGLPDEARYDVPPLATPAADDADELDRSPAVQLLTDRARLASRWFTVTDEDGPWVAELTRRLDGLPLALELAAARLTTVSPRVVVERLSDGLDLLASDARGRPERHRALEATIAWSHDLLTGDQARLFARLSVFAGTFTLEAAEAVCADDQLPRSAVAPALTSLVDRSMVATVRSAGGRLRYRLLQTVRSFARDRLAESAPGADVQRDRHLAWASDLAAEVVADLDRPDQLEVLARLEAERDDLVAALSWADRHGRDDDATVIGTALAWLFAKLGQYGRAIDRLTDAIGRVDEAAEPERAGDLRSRLAGIHYSAGREREAMAEANRARHLLADRPPSAAKVRALTEHASLHMRIVQRDHEVPIGSAQGAIDAAEAIGDRFAHAHALRTLGTALSRAGDHAAGVASLRDALVIARELDHDSELLGVYLSLFITLLELAEDLDAAMDVADDALAWLDRGGDRLAGSASLLMWIAYGSVKAGRLAQATTTLDRSARYHLEGAMRMSELAIRGLIAWAEDRIDDAADAADQLRTLPATPRYYRILYPLEAEVAAARGRPAEVDDLVRRHLAEDLRDVEQPLKLGTIWPAVRLAVDAALDGDGPDRAAHRARARALVDRMRSLIERYPPSPPSGLRFEMPDTYLALAEAELTRLGAPDPDAWREAGRRSAYAHWRAYAGRRRAEAEARAGEPADARPVSPTA